MHNIRTIKLNSFKIINGKMARRYLTRVFNVDEYIFLGYDSMRGGHPITEEVGSFEYTVDGVRCPSLEVLDKYFGKENVSMEDMAETLRKELRDDVIHSIKDLGFEELLCLYFEKEDLRPRELICENTELECPHEDNEMNYLTDMFKYKDVINSALTYQPVNEIAESELYGLLNLVWDKPNAYEVGTDTSKLSQLMCLVKNIAYHLGSDIKVIYKNKDELQYNNIYSTPHVSIENRLLKDYFRVERDEEIEKTFIKTDVYNANYKPSKLLPRIYFDADVEKDLPDDYTAMTAIIVQYWGDIRCAIIQDIKTNKFYFYILNRNVSFEYCGDQKVYLSFYECPYDDRFYPVYFISTPETVIEDREEKIITLIQKRKNEEELKIRERFEEEMMDACYEGGWSCDDRVPTLGLF